MSSYVSTVHRSIVLVAVATLCTGCGNDSDDTVVVEETDDTGISGTVSSPDAFTSRSEDRTTAAERIQQAVDSLNATIDSHIGTYCDCYADQTHDGDVEACRKDQRENLLSISPCEKAAARCDLAGFERAMSCFATAYEDLEACEQSCPGSSELKQCADDAQKHIQNCVDQAPEDLVGGFDHCEADGDAVCAPLDESDGDGNQNDDGNQNGDDTTDGDGTDDGPTCSGPNLAVPTNSCLDRVLSSNKQWDTCGFTGQYNASGSKKYHMWTELHFTNTCDQAVHVRVCTYTKGTLLNSDYNWVCGYQTDLPPGGEVILGGCRNKVDHPLSGLEAGLMMAAIPGDQPTACIAQCPPSLSNCHASPQNLD